MSQRTTYILIAFICLIPVIVLGTTGIPVLTNVEPDGDVTLADGKHVATDEVRARDAGGLALYDDGGAMGIEISDAGAVTVTELASGLVKSTSGVLSAATAGTDYLTPSANATLDDTYYFAADEVRARDGDGLDLADDSGTVGIQIPDGGGVDIWLNPSPGADDTGNGTKAIMTIDSGATIAVGDCLHMDSDSEWVEADADAMATMPCQAMALETGTGSKAVLLKGSMRNDDWNWTPGAVLYVSTTTGEITDVAPSGSGDVVQVVGWAVTADIIRFAPELDRIEVQ